MSKEILTISNLNRGNLETQINQAIRDANTALDDNSNAGTSEITVKISIKSKGADGDFREVSSKVSLKKPTVAPHLEFLPVNQVDGVKAIMVDTTPAPVQGTIPGIAHLNRNAS